MEAAYGINPEVYTEGPDIGSASDFNLGLSTQGFDFSTYADPSNQGRGTPGNFLNNTATNDFGSTVSVGYGAGQVDPALAAAAGYTNAPPTFLEGLLGSIPAGNNPVPKATQNKKEREEQEVISAISGQGGQNLIDQGALASDNLTESQKNMITRDFGTLTTDQVASNAAMDSTIKMSNRYSESGALIKEAAANGELGAAVNGLLEKYGGNLGNLEKLQEKGNLSFATIEDIKKIAAAKGIK